MTDIEDIGSKKLTRIAIIDPNKCKPTKCQKECKKYCPVDSTGKKCVEIQKISTVSEILCIGCGICEKKCPFGAIKIVNLPISLNTHITHRYSNNSFKLHKLPHILPGKICGLVGSNGIGKSTVMKILSGDIIPNFGNYIISNEWKRVIDKFKGSEMQKYFTSLSKFNISVKKQYTEEYTQKYIREFNIDESMLINMDLNHLLDRDISCFSGGEKQRLSIAIAASKNANVFMFDEPSSFLDIKQRINASNVINNISKRDNYVLCIEHDLTILDYLSDYVSILYGEPNVYGVVTTMYNTREGINMYIDGYIPNENLRFRENSLNFNIGQEEFVENTNNTFMSYDSHKITYDNFELNICSGNYRRGEIIILLGENGMGKTTFINDINKLYNCSLKPQTISPKFKGTVEELLNKRISGYKNDILFMTYVFKQMDIESIIENKVLNLSGGELQRLALTICLGTPADIYLIDEPSAYLDSVQRITVSNVIKKYIKCVEKTAFIVEHDIMMSITLADRVIVYEGIPGIKTTANSPQDVNSGMNKFLKQLEVTFRKDGGSNRPRINKKNSVKDREQKLNGIYYN